MGSAVAATSVTAPPTMTTATVNVVLLITPVIASDPDPMATTLPPQSVAAVGVRSVPLVTVPVSVPVPVDAGSFNDGSLVVHDPLPVNVVVVAVVGGIKRWSVVTFSPGDRKRQVPATTIIASPVAALAGRAGAKETTKATTTVRAVNRRQ